MTQELDFDQLIDTLIEADKVYHDSDGSSETMTDREYDRLKRRLFAENPAHPYFLRVGSTVREGKIKLPYTMGSLTQLYNQDLPNWIANYDLTSKNLIETDKEDGISGMVEYRDGKFIIAYSRGDGMEGADISRHVTHLSTVPKTVEDEYLVVRGELIMKNRTFDKNWSSKFANPRVTVAGTMNRSVSNMDIIADIEFIAYEIVASSSSYKSKTEQLHRLEELGFKVVPYRQISGKNLTVEYLTNAVKNAKIRSEYELDGIVLTIDEFGHDDAVRTAISLNPENSVKFKVNDADDEVVTTVTDIKWEISKNGLYKPRVELMPVKLFGTVVTYATGHNANNIVENGIGIGATIKVTKSGSVIPYITEVVKPAPKLNLPDFSEGEWEWNSTGVEIVLREPEKNRTVRLKQVLDFMETLNVELLKESTLRKAFDHFNLWDKSFSQSVVTLASLYEAEWINAVGSNGSKIFTSLERRLQKMALETFLGAVSYMPVGFGVRKAKTLLSGCGATSVWDVTSDQVAVMDGFSEDTAPAIVRGLREAQPLYHELVDGGYMTVFKEVKTAEMKGVVVVMTGFRDPELAELIESRGGKNGTGVSGKTTHLLTVDPSSNSGKAKKARDLGVAIMTPDEFKDEFDL
jgi:NAD-dependent DNA ligase